MPAEAEALVAELRARGVELRAVGDRLRYKPAFALTPADVEVLRKHKEAVIALLRAASPWVDLSPSAVSAALGPEPDAHAVAGLRLDVLAAVRQLEAEIASGAIGPRPLLIHGQPLGDWLDLAAVARLLRDWRERPRA